VLMVQEDVRLLFSDPVGKYLPELSETSVAMRKGSGTGMEVLRVLLDRVSG